MRHAPHTPGATPAPDHAPRYWPAIDGLRAIAVLAVFLFHLDRNVLAGGFVGVDIFFVISGFLITTNLLGDLDTGRFSLLRFYQRRIARIAPAFLLVLAVTLLAGAVIYSAQDFASLGANAVAAALSLINMKLILQGDYFRISEDAQPLLHYWSLAVEEQFYLLFPFYLWAAVRLTRRPLTITLIAGAVSLILCVVATYTAPTSAFYLLPTRAWELGAGAALALAFRQRGGLSGGVPRPALLGWGGLGLIAISFFAIRDSSPFPGIVAVAPVLGSVMVIAAATAIPARGGVEILLAQPAAVFVGKLSYSLYLWHWPVFSFVDYQLYDASHAERLVLKLTLSVILSVGTYFLVETPARKYLRLPTHRYAAFGGFLAAAIALSAVGIGIRAANYFDTDPAQIAEGGRTIHGGDRATLALVGDSQAVMYGSVLARLARDRDLTLHVLATPGVNQLPNEENTTWPQVERFLTERQPEIVIIAEAWATKLRDGGGALGQALDVISAYGGKAIVLTQSPLLPDDATRASIRAGAANAFFEDRDFRDDRLATAEILSAIKRPDVAVVDAGALYERADGAIRLRAPNGRFAFHDASHLSSEGAALVAPLLDAAIADALGD